MRRGFSCVSAGSLHMLPPTDHAGSVTGMCGRKCVRRNVCGSEALYVQSVKGMHRSAHTQPGKERRAKAQGRVEGQYSQCTMRQTKQCAGLSFKWHEQHICWSHLQHKSANIQVQQMYRNKLHHAIEIGGNNPPPACSHPSSSPGTKSTCMHADSSKYVQGKCEWKQKRRCACPNCEQAIHHMRLCI